MIVQPQLFLLHFAGGNQYSYSFLKPHLEGTFQCISLELPGRGKRFSEPLLRSKKQAINDYLGQIKAARNDAPFFIYGHSMGAIMAFEVAAMLESLGDVPRAVIATGSAGPDIKREEIRYNLKDEAFINVLQEMGGTPDEVIQNKELLELFMPIIRADFEVVENPDLPSADALSQVTIYAVMGNNEEHAGKIANWNNYTKVESNQHLFEGGHFFIQENEEKLAELIINASKEILV